jgi:hypothetical protein
MTVADSGASSLPMTAESSWFTIVVEDQSRALAVEHEDLRCDSDEH